MFKSWPLGKESLTMRRVILLLAMFVLYRDIDSKFKMLFERYTALAQKNEVLGRSNNDLANEASKWKNRAEKLQNHSPLLQPQESPRELAARAHTLARDILDFENEKEMSRPAMILVVAGGEATMRRNSEEIAHYDVDAVTEFLKQFGGPMNGFVRKSRPYDLDTSRLQRHIATINNILVMRLIANDLADLSDQLSTPVIKRQRPAPEPRIEPQIRSTANAGQE